MVSPKERSWTCHSLSCSINSKGSVYLSWITLNWLLWIKILGLLYFKSWKTATQKNQLSLLHNCPFGKWHEYIALADAILTNAHRFELKVNRYAKNQLLTQRKNNTFITSNSITKKGGSNN